MSTQTRRAELSVCAMVKAKSGASPRAAKKRKISESPRSKGRSRLVGLSLLTRDAGKSKQVIEEIESEDEFDKLLDDADGCAPFDAGAHHVALTRRWTSPLASQLSKTISHGLVRSSSRSTSRRTRLVRALAGIAATDPAAFQQIDIEEYTEPGQPPTLRIYGVTEEGHSVLAHITDFMPYLYVSAPRGFQNTDCEPFKTHLNVRVAALCSDARRASSKAARSPFTRSRLQTSAVCGATRATTSRRSSRSRSRTNA